MKSVCVIGTFDTKGEELAFLVEQVESCGVSTITVDVSLRTHHAEADVSALDVAANHPEGPEAVFASDRPGAIEAMGEALREYLVDTDPADAYLAVGGSTGSSIVGRAFRSLPLGTPRLLVSSVVAGDVSEYVGASDLALMHSVADLSGLNSITRAVLANAAYAAAGMATWRRSEPFDGRTNVALTTLGVTSACSDRVRANLADQYECITFTATPTGDRAARDLIEHEKPGLFIDVCLSDIAKTVVAGQDGDATGRQSARLEAIAATGTPYLACLGGLDFTVWRGELPPDYDNRAQVDHNSVVTLVRTSADECHRIALHLADQVNAMGGPVHLLVPNNGLSALDGPGQPFHDPESNRALFAALDSHFRSSDDHILEQVPSAINDIVFAERVVDVAKRLIRR